MLFAAGHQSGFRFQLALGIVVSEVVFDGQAGVVGGAFADILLVGDHHGNGEFGRSFFFAGVTDKPVKPGFTALVVDGAGFAADLQPGQNGVFAGPPEGTPAGAGAHGALH